MRASVRAGVVDATPGSNKIFLVWLCPSCEQALREFTRVLARRPWFGPRRRCNGCDTDVLNLDPEAA